MNQPTTLDTFLNIPRFGELTPIGEGKRSPRGRLTIRCRCSCGSIVDVERNRLIMPKPVRSCGHKFYSITKVKMRNIVSKPTQVQSLELPRGFQI